MNAVQGLSLLRGSLEGVRCAAPEGSPYGKAGREILTMASAYASDGMAFLNRADTVNAIAAFAYGLGFLHFGIASGLLVPKTERHGCPFRETFEPVPPEEAGRCREKSGRYARLLETAISSADPAPDPSTPAFVLAVRVGAVAGTYLRHGGMVLPSGKDEEALACFSYGHGWLDAGVTAGLFAIRTHREIFTVD